MRDSAARTDCITDPTGGGVVGMVGACHARTLREAAQRARSASARKDSKKA